MSYEAFKEKVLCVIRKAGNDISVRFSNDTDIGRYSAKCSDGTTITGNSVNKCVAVLFGSGHQAMAIL